MTDRQVGTVGGGTYLSVPLTASEARALIVAAGIEAAVAPTETRGHLGRAIATLRAALAFADLENARDKAAL